MFNIDFEDKKTMTTLRFLAYALMGVAAGIITTLLVLAAQGYDIDRQTGEVIQNGLILVDSQPASGQVFVNGQSENDNTPSRLPLPAGRYSVLIRRDGYHDWEKDVTLAGSDVLWMSYPKLIPTDIQTTAIRNYAGVQFAAQSRNKERLLIARDVRTYELINIDAPADDALQAFVLPEGLVQTAEDGGQGVITNISWDGQAGYVLIEHTYGSLVEYIVLDTRKPTETWRNLNKDFALTISSARFKGDSSTELYVRVDDSLRLLDLGNGTVSAPIVQRVVDYNVRDRDTATFVRLNEADKYEVGFVYKGEVLVATILPKNGGVPVFAYEAYDRNDYLAVSRPDQQDAVVFKNPINAIKEHGSAVAMLEVSQSSVEKISFSDTGQFVAFQSGRSIAVYDVEEDKTYNFTLTPQSVSKVAWMDGHRLRFFDDKGTVSIVEFDGGNSHEIALGSSELGVFFDKAYENMFTYAASASVPGELELKQSSLIVEQ